MPEEADGRALTWAGLLGRWMELARSAVALPEAGEGGRWKRAVAPIIGLQAVTHALGEVDLLPPDQRRVGLDRAELLIREHTRELHEIWRGEALPGELTELITDAWSALRGATSGGLEWVVAEEALVCGHPGELIEALAGLGFAGDLYVPTPGVPVLEGEPGAFCREDRGGPVEGRVAELVGAFVGEPEGTVREARHAALPRQVYREFDFSAGGPIRDVVTLMDADPRAGQPVLVPAVLRGRPQAVTLPPRVPVLDAPIPVVDLTEGGPASGRE